jgi:hypothetical protein
MATIVTRAGKGSALTWTEGDANITNLNNAKLENVVEDLTPQLGGNLDVNGNSIVSASNGNINIVPNGSGNINITPATGKIVLGPADWPATSGSAGQVLTTSGGTGVLSWETPSSGGASTLDDLSDVVITAAATNDVLVYNGTNWVDTAANTLTVSAASTATTATGATNISISTTTGNTSDTTLYPVMVGAASTGNQLPHLDSALVYNASTDTLTATGFAGALNGTVGATTPNLGTFTGATVKGANALNRARLILDNTTHYSTAWTTTGIGIVATDNTIFRDTSSSGTVSNVYIHNLGSANLERGNTGAFTNAVTLRVGVPTAGFQATITNPALAILAEGPVRVTGNLTIDGGSSLSGAHNGTVGATTPSTGAFTTLSASTSVSFSPSGAITLNPTTAGTINNMSIGATTASTGRFTTVTSTATTGTAPFTVASTTNVANLNASSLNGATFAAPGAIGSTTKAAGTFTTMTADVAVLDDIRETVAALTYGATITPNAADGSIRTITLTGNVTFSAFTTPISGQTITLIITQDGTGSRTLTSTFKFSGASKTLSTAAGAIDILTVSYIGTTYYASLAKGFA